MADAAQLASLADETPEGRSIVVLAKEKYGLRGRDIHSLGATFVPFTAQTRMSGVNFDGRQIRKGAADAIETYVRDQGGVFPAAARTRSINIAKEGGTPLVVADGLKALGVIQLKDIVKGGMKERFAELRRMGIKTVMITGDNPLTAAAIAAEAGVDDFLAQATPETKLNLIREYQSRRPIGGDDGRRHQRRARAGASRRGRGDEHRHAGRQGSGQHGRSGFQSDQVDRGGGDRQAAA